MLDVRLPVGARGAEVERVALGDVVGELVITVLAEAAALLPALDHRPTPAAVARQVVRGERCVGCDQPGVHERSKQQHEGRGVAAGVRDPIGRRDRLYCSCMGPHPRGGLASGDCASMPLTHEVEEVLLTPPGILPHHSSGQQIASMTSQLGTMNKSEKLDHIADCKGLIDKQRTFYGRLCLAASEDPEAADMRVRIDALSSAFGYKDLSECMEAMVMTLEQAAQAEIDRD